MGLKFSVFLISLWNLVCGIQFWVISLHSLLFSLFTVILISRLEMRFGEMTS